MAKAPGSDDEETIGQGTIGGEAQTGDGGGEAVSITNGGGPSDDLIMRYVAQMDVQQGEVDKHEAAKKAAQKGMTTIRQRAKADGIKLKNLDAEMKRRTLARHEQRADLEEQDRYARILGNETWEAADLFARTAEGAKDEIDHEAAGYAAGKRLLPATPPENVPPEMRQHWLKGHDRGADEMMKALGGNKPEPIIETADTPSAPKAKPAAKKAAGK